VDECAENYINNMETAKHHADLLGARYLNFLQPFVRSEKRRLSKFDVHAIRHMTRRVTTDGNNELDLIVQFYDTVCQKTKDKDCIYDLRNIFDNYNGEIYFDQTHCSNIGYDIIGKEIAEQIIKIEKDREGL